MHGYFPDTQEHMKMACWRLVALIIKNTRRGCNKDRFQEISKIALDELSEVFARMSDENVRELLEEIKNAKRVFLLGAGREGLSTREFAMRLMHLGKESHWIWDDTTPSMNKGDLFICACGSADVAHENIICDNAKKTGATILLITPSAKGHILEIADKVIRIPATAYKAVYNSEDEYVPTAQMMGNQFEQALLVFFDVIVMMLSEEMGISKEEMEARHRNIE